MAQDSEQLVQELSIFEDVIKSFTNEIPPDVLDHFRDIRSLDDLKIAISNIEKEQAARRSIRNLKKINPLLNGLREYAGVIEVFVNAKPDIMAFIWGPIKFCLQVASKYNHAFDSLLGAYAKIRDALPNFVIIQQLYAAQHDAIALLLRHVYMDILTFHKRAVRFFSKPGWKIAIKMTCRALDDCFGDVLQNLQYSKELLYTRTGLTHYYESHQARVHTEQAFREQQEREKQARRLKVHAWLDAFSHQNQQHELQKVRTDHPGTCTWLFKERCWIDWITNAGNSRKGFWISGIPGAGKTVLFSAMVNELQSRVSLPDISGVVVYVYCKYNDSLRDNFVALARSLISILLQHNDEAYDYMYDIAADSTEHAPTTKETLSACINDLLQFHEHVYLGIDGLDEIEPQERSFMIQLVQRLLAVPNDSHCLQVFLTSRAEHDLEKAFSSLDRIRLDSCHVSPDIQTYAQIRVGELAFLQLENTVLQQLVRTIVGRSEGMFLLAKLTFDMFCLCITREDFEYERHNRELPQGIEEAYCRILERISVRERRASRPKAARLLEILTFARRTLYMHEVQTALSINTTLKDLDFQGRRYTQPLKQICGALVEVHSDDSVTLVHATAKQFLMEHSHDMFDTIGANFRMAQLCIIYLSMDVFCHNSTEDGIKSAVMQGCFGFHRYAFCNWSQHASTTLESQQHSEDDISGLIMEISNVMQRQSLVASGTIGMTIDSAGAADIRQRMTDWLKSITHDMKVIKEESDERLGTASLENAMNHEARIQKAIEHQIEGASSPENKDFLAIAYGKMPFLCHKLGCLRSYKGFKSEKERNTHSKLHERPYKCTFNDCVFRLTGYASKAALQKHNDTFHLDNLSFKFSQLEARAPEERLFDAIDANDPETFQVIYFQQAAKGCYPPKPWLLLIRALENGTGNLALCIVKCLGDGIFGANSWHAVNSVLAAASGTHDSEAIHLVLKTLSPQFWSKEWPRIVRHVIRKGQPDVLKILMQQIRLSGISSVLKINASLALDNQNAFEMFEVLQGLPDVFRIDTKTRVEICKVAAIRGHQNLLRLLFPAVLEVAEFRMPMWQDMQDAPSHEAKLFRFQRALCGPTISDLERALGSGSLVNIPQMFNVDSLSEIGLSIAAERGLLLTVQYLITSGKIDIQATSEIHWTALHQASFSGHLSIVQYLVEHGADLEANFESLGKPLHQAACNGNLSIAEYLIERGANVNVSSEKYGTALQQASLNGHLSVVQCLVENGADVDTSSDTHATALQKASYNGHLPVVQYLVDKGANLDASSESHRTALQEASLNGHLPVIQYLVDKGANIDACSEVHATALQEASYWGHLSVVQCLVENGADLEASSDKFSTALNQASRNGQLAVVQYLINVGAEIRSSLQTRGAAVHKASLNGHLPVVQYLIEHGADIHANFGHHGTALHQAVIGGNSPIVQYLIARGADLEASSDAHGTPLNIAAREMKFSIVEYLVNRGAKLEACKAYHQPLLYRAVKAGSVDLVKRLLDAGAQVNIRGKAESDSEFSTSLLQEAVKLLHFGMVQLLLSRGADVGWTTPDGWTALHIALYLLPSTEAEMSIVTSLLKAGADPNVGSGTDKSLLRAFIESSKSSWHHVLSQDLFQSLVDYGLDCTSRDEHGRSILVEWDDVNDLPPHELWHLLVKNGADIDMIDLCGYSGRDHLSRFNPEVLHRFGLKLSSFKGNNGKTEVVELDTDRYEYVDTVMQDVKGEDESPWNESAAQTSLTLESHAVPDDSREAAETVWEQDAYQTRVFDESLLSYNPWVLDESDFFVDHLEVAPPQRQDAETDEMYD